LSLATSELSISRTEDTNELNEDFLLLKARSKTLHIQNVKPTAGSSQHFISLMLSLLQQKTDKIADDEKKRH
jgi:hypothetical protein